MCQPQPAQSGGGVWKAVLVIGMAWFMWIALTNPQASAKLSGLPSLPKIPKAGVQSKPKAKPPAVTWKRVTATTSHGCDPARDLRSGPLDQRVWRLLAVASERWRLRVSCARTGHSKYVKGTRRVSNHHGGRAIDIDQVNGRPVHAGNRDAEAFARWLGQLSGPLAPSEIGGPWPWPGRYFTDGGHQGHIHVGYGS